MNLTAQNLTEAAPSAPDTPASVPDTPAERHHVLGRHGHDEKGPDHGFYFIAFVGLTAATVFLILVLKYTRDFRYRRSRIGGVQEEATSDTEVLQIE